MTRLALTYRKLREWTQVPRAACSGLSQLFISDLEQGRYATAEPATPQRLAGTLGPPLREVLAAAGITDALDRRGPPLPPLATRYPAGLPALWGKLTPEEQAQVEDLRAGYGSGGRGHRKSRYHANNQAPCAQVLFKHHITGVVKADGWPRFLALRGQVHAGRVGLLPPTEGRYDRQRAIPLALRHRGWSLASPNYVRRRFGKAR